MIQSDTPVGVGVVGIKIVIFFSHLPKAAACDGWCLVHRIHTGSVQRYRVKRGKESDIRDNGDIILAMAITVWGDVDDEIDMETVLVLANRLGIFRYLATQHVVGIPVRIADCILGADGKATAATYTVVQVDSALVIADLGPLVGADAFTGATADTKVLVHFGLAVTMLLHLACTGTSSHPKVLQRSSETRALMALEVGQGNDHISITKGSSNLRFLDILSVPYRDEHLVVALDAIGDDDLATGCDCVETIEIGTIHMLQGILSATDIQGVTVGKERLSPKTSDDISDHLGIIRTEEGKIAWFSEVHFDGNELIGEIDFCNTGGFDKAFQLEEP